MKKIVISAGPIPGKLDSVKYLTNRFKGGLAFETAKKLFLKGFDVTIVKWKYTEFEPTWGNIKIVNIEDVNEYMEYMTTHEFDAYILAGAVANLIPVNPWEGKFPSHKYKVGEEFDIKFTIAPRIIDEIKKKYPRSTLIGYKLFDGSEEELIEAGWETLINSKSNCVFCNHPKTAKTEKIALLPDGSIHRMNFEEHINFIERIINLDWYKTEIVPTPDFELSLMELGYAISEINKIVDKISVTKEPYKFGTVAIKMSFGILTTTRGKRDSGNCIVVNVDHQKKIVYSTKKATLNVPFMDLLFKLNPEYYVIVHGHKKLENCATIPYIFDGTSECWNSTLGITINVDGHGYYKMYKTLKDAQNGLE